MKDIELEVIPKLPEQPVGWLEVNLPKFVMKKLKEYIKNADAEAIDEIPNLNEWNVAE